MTFTSSISSPHVITEGDVASTIAIPTYTLDPTPTECWNVVYSVTETTSFSPDFQTQVGTAVSIDNGQSPPVISIPATTLYAIGINTYSFTLTAQDSVDTAA